MSIQMRGSIHSRPVRNANNAIQWLQVELLEELFLDQLHPNMVGMDLLGQGIGHIIANHKPQQEA